VDTANTNPADFLIDILGSGEEDGNNTHDDGDDRDENTRERSSEQSVGVLADRNLGQSLSQHYRASTEYIVLMRHIELALPSRVATASARESYRDVGHSGGSVFSLPPLLKGRGCRVTQSLSRYHPLDTSIRDQGEEEGRGEADVEDEEGEREDELFDEEKDDVEIMGINDKRGERRGDMELLQFLSLSRQEETHSALHTASQTYVLPPVISDASAGRLSRLGVGDWHSRLTLQIWVLLSRRLQVKWVLFLNASMREER
jgi:hypothetical protein